MGLLKKTAFVGCLTTLVPVMLVIVGLLFAGDVFARRYATGQLSDRISAALPEASGVRARIKSFPFVGKLLIDGKVDDVGVHIDRLAPVRGLSFTDLDVDLRGAVLDGNAFVTARQVTLKHVRQGTFTVSVSEAALSQALGRTVHVTGGAVDVVLLGGRAVPAGLSVTPRHQLVVQVAGLPALVELLPSVKILPCAPRLTVGQGSLTLSCTFATVPDAFVQLASSGAGASG